MQQPSGGMLSVNVSDNVVPFLDSNIEISVINAPTLCVVSGTLEHLRNLAENSQITISRIGRNTSHAFHSYLMQGQLIHSILF